MRLGRYLTEAELTAGDIISTIEKDCGPFVRELRKGGKPIWRGIWKTMTGDLIRRKPRKNRKPLDTDPFIHDALDKAFKNKWGWKARSEAVFCSTKYMDAIGYGHAYMFFAIGKYEVLFRKDVADLQHWIPYWTQLLQDNPIKAAHAYNDWADFEKIERMRITNADDVEKKLYKALDKITNDLAATFEKGNFSKVVNQPIGVELMFRCKEYYLVPYDWLDSIRPLWKG